MTRHGKRNHAFTLKQRALVARGKAGEEAEHRYYAKNPRKEEPVTEHPFPFVEAENMNLIIANRVEDSLAAVPGTQVRTGDCGCQVVLAPSSLRLVDDPDFPTAVACLRCLSPESETLLDAFNDVESRPGGSHVVEGGIAELADATNEVAARIITRGMTEQAVEFAERPSDDSMENLGHIHIAGRCVKNRGGERCV